MQRRGWPRQNTKPIGQYRRRFYQDSNQTFPRHNPTATHPLQQTLLSGLRSALTVTSVQGNLSIFGSTFLNWDQFQLENMGAPSLWSWPPCYHHFTPLYTLLRENLYNYNHSSLIITLRFLRPLLSAMPLVTAKSWRSYHYSHYTGRLEIILRNSRPGIALSCESK